MENILALQKLAVVPLAYVEDGASCISVSPDNPGCESAHSCECGCDNTYTCPP